MSIIRNGRCHLLLIPPFFGKYVFFSEEVQCCEKNRWVMVDHFIFLHHLSLHRREQRKVIWNLTLKEFNWTSKTLLPFVNVFVWKNIIYVLSDSWNLNIFARPPKYFFVEKEKKRITNGQALLSATSLYKHFNLDYFRSVYEKVLKSLTVKLNKSSNDLFLVLIGLRRLEKHFILDILTKIKLNFF